VKHSVNALLDLCYEVYPRGVWLADAHYKDTPESHRQVEAQGRARAEYHGRWRPMLARMKAQFPGCAVHDGSLHLWGSGFDPAYSGKLVLPVLAPEEGEHALAFQVSLLAPYYVIYNARFVWQKGGPGEGAAPLHEVRLDLSPTDQPYARGLAQEIEAAYGYEPMPLEVGRVGVPEVSTNRRAMGEATIYDCLLSDDWLTISGSCPRI
jgi:hypothetical protein